MVRSLLLIPFLAPALCLPFGSYAVNDIQQPLHVAPSTQSSDIPPGENTSHFPSHAPVEPSNTFSQPLVLVEFQVRTNSIYLKVPLDRYLSPLSTAGLPSDPDSVNIVSIQRADGGVYEAADKVQCSALAGGSRAEGRGGSVGSANMILVHKANGRVDLRPLRDAKDGAMARFGCRTF